MEYMYREQVPFSNIEVLQYSHDYYFREGQYVLLGQFRLTNPISSPERTKAYCFDERAEVVRGVNITISGWNKALNEIRFTCIYDSHIQIEKCNLAFYYETCISGQAKPTSKAKPRDIETHCKSCGAPLDLTHDKCGYCGTYWREPTNR